MAKFMIIVGLFGFLVGTAWAQQQCREWKCSRNFNGSTTCECIR